MSKEERYDQHGFSWGTYFGFPYFFSRRMLLPGLLHLILLIIAGFAIWKTLPTNPGVVKWLIFGTVIVELGILTYFGFKSNRLSWNACRWKDPHGFTRSNSVWGFFGRLLLLVRVLNVIAYVFFDEPYRFTPTPGWVVLLGYILIPLLIAAIVWRIRGPIWAVALNTLKESINKLEVITLFIIGVVFVILFNGIWHVPSIRDGIVNSPLLQKDAGYENVPEGLGGEVEDFKVDLSTHTKAFTEDNVHSYKFRLQAQAVTFLFGEFFITLICFVLGIYLITGEIHRGVVLTVLPKPIGRGEYVLGKILGAWVIVVICFEAIAIVALLFALPYRGTPSDNIANIVHAMALMPIKFAILISMITYLSLWLPEAVAGIFGLTIFIAGHTSQKILDMALDDFAEMPIVSQALKAAYVMLPHLSEMASPVVMDPDQTLFELASIKLPWGQVHTATGFIFEWVFWACLYFAIVTALAVLSFRKRSL